VSVWQTLLTSVEDGVARVTLNRPEVRNALSRTLHEELGRALAEREADPATRVVVLAGAGDRAFCAGADLKGIGDRGTTLEARESSGGLVRILTAITAMRKPVIAQVHGWALAGGAGWRRAATSSSPPTMRSSACPRSRWDCCRSW